MKEKWLVGVVAALFLAPLGAFAAGQARTIEIAVTAKGFEPARVKVAKGVPLKLVVTRKTDDTCAKEIVIPDENLKADLPLNKPVTLSFTPTKSGEIRYACGMNMVSGVLVVASNTGPTLPEPGGIQAREDDMRGARGMRSMQGGMMAGGMMRGRMMGGGGMMGGSMEEMSGIHALLTNHEKIHRSVEDIPGGVRTTTTSDDPQIAALIREHVRQMKARIEEGRPIREMDPLFRELFANHEHVHIDIVEVPGGARVTETSDTPRVTPLIRQHARRAVSEFVAEGMPRAMQPTPLPPGYVPADPPRRSGAQQSGCCCSPSST